MPKMDTKQTSVTAPRNDVLPIDVLFTIFDKYSIWDGVNHPLEKLLYICKSWSNAAKQHRALWSCFSIDIYLDKHIRFWSSRVANRIGLSGDDVPLDIEFALSHGFKTDKWEAVILSISKSLIGEGGSLVKRWRRLRLWNPSSASQTLWNEALTVPTPNLQSFDAYNLSFSRGILPFAPSLEILTIQNSKFDLCGSFDQLKTLNLSGVISNIGNLEAALQSRGLTTLLLAACYRPLRIPVTLPRLQTLLLHISVDSTTLESFSLPNLKTLKVPLAAGIRTDILIQWRGIDFRNLTELHIECSIKMNEYPESLIRPSILGLKEIVQAAANVQTFKVNGIPAISGLLLCIQENLHPRTLHRGCTLEVGYSHPIIYTWQRCTFDITPQTIQDDISHIRSFADLPKHETWESLIERFAKY
ncbi:hypothetical protein CPB86DRAFT_812469 [Serendipita vermifera]|nr:hypothetical protein CPB86DRAFT_812469 [Serendipita vermifera]